MEGFVHCRNCTVYNQASMVLLRRPLPADYRQDCTAYFARGTPERHMQNFSTVVFRVAREWFALPTEVLQEIAERRCVHSLPHRRHSVVLGLANVRGELVICVSLARFLGLMESQLERSATDYRRLVVASWQGHRLGLAADHVHGTCRFNLRDLQSPPATLARAGSTYTRGLFPWQDQSVGLLDPDRLFPKLNEGLV